MVYTQSMAKNLGNSAGSARRSDLFCSSSEIVNMNGILANRTSDGTTRRLWYKLGRAHDFEMLPGMTARGTMLLSFSASYMQLSVILLWASVLVFQLAWQGTFESWCQVAHTTTPLAHAVRDPHLGVPYIGRVGDVLLGVPCCSGLYQWFFTLGIRWTSE